MPELICYIPFPPTAARNGFAGDLRANAQELMDANANMPSTGTGQGLNNRRIVYWGQENQNQANDPDVIVVCGHGAPDDTDLSDNAGNTRTQAELLNGLAQLSARNASEVYFFACHSGMAGHIGPVFKTANQNVRVFATTEPAEGALIGTTRSGMITRAVWSGRQLNEL